MIKVTHAARGADRGCGSSIELERRLQLDEALDGGGAHAAPPSSILSDLSTRAAKPGMAPAAAPPGAPQAPLSRTGVGCSFKGGCNTSLPLAIPIHILRYYIAIFILIKPLFAAFN